MQCSPTQYILFLNTYIMNTKMVNPQMLRNDDKKSVIYGVVICCDCGSTKTTLTKKGVYCNECKSFRRFKKRKFELIPPYVQYDDDD